MIWVSDIKRRNQNMINIAANHTEASTDIDGDIIIVEQQGESEIHLHRNNLNFKDNVNMKNKHDTHHYE